VKSVWWAIGAKGKVENVPFAKDFLPDEANEVEHWRQQQPESGMEFFVDYISP
jgi:hypothetical protein